MREKRQDQSLKRAKAHLARILQAEKGRDDAVSTYTLIATQLLALGFERQRGGQAASRFLHGVWVQLRDDLRTLGVDLGDLPSRLTG